MNEVLFSSKETVWETPQDFFDKLDKEFHFDIDVAALPENAKCYRFYTPADDGLNQPWAGNVWCNPPYGRGISDWARKASESASGGLRLSC